MNTNTTQIAFRAAGVPGVQQNEFLRHGEWLFVPAPGLVVDASRIRRHAALHTGAALVEELYRSGGEAHYYSASLRRVLTVPQYRALLRRRPAAVHEDWRIVQREINAYARGTVRHAEHPDLTLPVWHRILLNSGTPSPHQTTHM